MKTINGALFVFSILICFCCSKESDMKEEPIELRSNFSETEFKNALIGEWKSVFEYTGYENVIYLNFDNQSKVKITIEKDGVKNEYYGDYSVDFLRESAEENVTLAKATISSSHKEIVLSYVYFGEHNALPANSGLFLRIEEGPYGVLKRAE